MKFILEESLRTKLIEFLMELPIKYVKVAGPIINGLTEMKPVEECPKAE